MELATFTATDDPAAVARDLAEYEALRNPTAEDAAILNGLRALAAGKVLIDLPATIRDGGLDEAGHPRLAVAWADWEFCYLDTSNGGAAFVQTPRAFWDERRRRLTVPDWPGVRGSWDHRALVPIIPPRHRPARSLLRRFAILWEVEEWAKAPRPPGDPALLRPVAGDLWAVEAVWDLTPLERAVLARRSLDPARQ